MSMADRAGKGIRGIRARTAGKLQQPPYHLLHLLFLRMAFAYHRLLDLQRSIFGNDEIIQDGSANRRATSLAQHQRGFRIDIHEYLFHRDLIGTMLDDHLVKMIHDGFKAQRQFTVHCLDASAADIGQLAASDVDNSKTRYAQAWIYAKDTDFSTFPCRKSYSSITAVV